MKKIDIKEYKKLFNTNSEGVDFDSSLSEQSINSDFELFEKSTKDQKNYTSKMTMEKWAFKVDGVDVGDDISGIEANGFPVLKEYLYDFVPTLEGVNSILDGGAGGGMNTKILSTKLNKDTKFYCVENHKGHCDHIKNNLSNRYDVNKPHVKVENFEVINASLHDIPMEDNSVDLVFTHAVMSHIPFLPAVLAVKELSRISSKYIVHIEQKNSVLNIVVPGYTKNKINRTCTMNYPKIYNELGYEKISYKEVPLGVGKQIMCVYVGKKKK